MKKKMFVGVLFVVSFCSISGLTARRGAYSKKNWQCKPTMRIFSMSVERYSAVSAIALALAAVYAAATRGSYYRACVFLWSSKAVSLLVANAALLAVYACGVLVQRIFLRELRPIEVAVSAACARRPPRTSFAHRNFSRRSPLRAAIARACVLRRCCRLQNCWLCAGLRARLCVRVCARSTAL